MPISISFLEAASERDKSMALEREISNEIIALDDVSKGRDNLALELHETKGKARRLTCKVTVGVSKRKRSEAVCRSRF
jgi:hypothetical protein